MPEKECRAGYVRRAAWLVGLGAVGPLAVAGVLYLFRVPLGYPGRFVYEYSPDEVIGLRASAVWPALLLAVLLAAGVWLVEESERRRRWLGGLALVLGLPALAVWAYRAPPDYLNQHVFNMQSPSQDGAFLLEAFTVERARDYLRDFPARAATPPELMRGTRVISNPPGATLLAYGLRRLSEYWPSLGESLRARIDVDDPELAEFRRTAAVGLAFDWVLTGLWLLSALPLYALGRLYFGRAAALAFCIAALVTAPNLLLTPGKDPAQLLTASLPVFLWLFACKRGGAWAGFLAGVLGVVSLMFSLVHAWIGAVALAATLWTVAPDRARLRSAILSAVVPASAGALLAAGAAYWLCDLNIWSVVRAVAASQAQVTRGPGAMPWHWQALGIPLFLLFAGPTFWSGALWRLGGFGKAVPDEDARFGDRLLLLTVVVLVATVGFTNIETPRLWIPFVPLLMLGLVLRLDLFRSPCRSGRRLLALLVGLQVACSALHWVLMDMRGTEYRLLSGSMFW